MDYEEWMQRARESIKTNVTNKAFELKSLFPECEWLTLTKGERINFGRYFANEVRENRVKGIKYIERAKDNHSKYIKIS